jgi:hypothetical protein
MPSRTLPTTRCALATCAFGAVTLIVCAALLGAAALAPAPPVVVPLITIVCVGCPMLAAWHLPAALAAVGRGEERAALAEMRRRLNELPETRHPLGL